ncbi:MAG: type II toxin-antitoxin system VapC family toxin [Myxococcota bacterium]
MKPTAYIETSVISYLTARMSNNLIIAAHQQITQTWWETKRQFYTLYISQLVIQEAAAGDPIAAEKRLAALQTIPRISLTPDAVTLAKALIQQKLLPEKAQEDSLHIAIAATQQTDYLLTWNFKHIANATMLTGIIRCCAEQGYQTPIICTPEQLLENNHE